MCQCVFMCVYSSLSLSLSLSHSLYIYIYICVCVCVCVCVWFERERGRKRERERERECGRGYASIKQMMKHRIVRYELYIYIYIYENFIKHNRHFMSTYFLLDPFEFPCYLYRIRGELIYVLSIVVCIPRTFCPTLGHHQGRIYYKSDVTFVLA